MFPPEPPVAITVWLARRGAVKGAEHLGAAKRTLATLTRNRVRMGEQLFDMLATPTTLQERAFDLLQVRP
jgi:hypothetical protein